jgi:two-component system response regulator FixJ
MKKLGGIFATVVSKPAKVSPQKLPPGSLVCVVDDDEEVLRSLSRLFRSFQLRVETYSSAESYLNRIPHDGPTCLVLDVQMPGIDGLELQRALAKRKVQIVFLTGHGNVSMCAGAMKAGAVDFLTKPVDDENLLAAVARGLARSVEVRRSSGERLAARALLRMLTPREFQVMQHVIAGLLNKQIAKELGTAEKTVKIHRGRVMEKMRVESVAELVRVAQVAGVSPRSSNARS